MKKPGITQEMIKPLPNYILLRPIEEETRSAGGIYLPEASKDKPMRGEVVGVGSFMPTESIGLVLYDAIKRAKKVIYKKWSNQEVQYEGENYLLVRFDELLAVIE